MAEPLRHRQTKEAATDMFYLKPPRHISTLLIASFRPRARHFRSTPRSGQFLSRSGRLKGANLRHRGCKPLKNRQPPTEAAQKENRPKAIFRSQNKGAVKL